MPETVAILCFVTQFDIMVGVCVCMCFVCHSCGGVFNHFAFAKKVILLKVIITNSWLMVSGCRHCNACWWLSKRPRSYFAEYSHDTEKFEFWIKCRSVVTWVLQIQAPVHPCVRWTRQQLWPVASHKRAQRRLLLCCEKGGGSMAANLCVKVRVLMWSTVFGYLEIPTFLNKLCFLRDVLSCK